MLMRIIRGVVVLVACLACGAKGEDADPSISPRRPNILFFITDDQFKDMMGWMPEGQGKTLTPNTDKIALEGTVLMQQYATSPVCTPSRFSCLTGKYPSRSLSKHLAKATEKAGGQTVVEWNTFITEDMVSLPAILKKAGYRTAIVGKNHVIQADGFEKPEWEADANDPETLALLARNKKKQQDALYAAGFDYAESLYFNNPSENGIKALASHNMDWIVKGAFDFLDQPSDKPFFLYVATTIPHGPGEPERSWNADRRITADGLLAEPLNILPPKESIPKRLEESGIGTRGNLENVVWLDDAFGALVAKLEALDQLDNTIILYFNDHGQLSKGTVYQGGVHAEAFIWRKGGWPVGSRSHVPVSNIDFVPTLMDIAGLVPKRGFEPYFDGRSFLPMLEGRTNKIHESLYFELGYVRGVLKDNWKLVSLRYPKSAVEMTREERAVALEEFNQNQERKGRPIYTTDPMERFSHVSLIPGGGDAEHMSMGKYPHFYDEDQLYDLSKDPFEQSSLVGKEGYADVLSDMKKELARHLRNLPGTFAEFKPR